MREVRYRHWRNPKTPAGAVFVTTTCLDFAHLLVRPSLKDALLTSLIEDILHYQLTLDAFVVMSHHWHALLRVPPSRTLPWAMQRLKSNSAKRLTPMLLRQETEQLSHQVGLDGRSFWMRSFRGIEIRREQMFIDTVEYIHYNPVKAELCALPEHYPWSSASLFLDSGWCEETGLNMALPDFLSGLRERKYEDS